MLNRQKPFRIRHHMGRRMLCCILVFTLFAQLLPAGIFADVIKEPPVSTAGEEDIYSAGRDLTKLTDEDIKEEIIELREENIKYFELEDGSRIAAVYETAVHEKDETGAFQDIDNSLQASEDGYENTSSSMRVKFTKNIKNGTLYTLKKDQYQIQWDLQGVKEYTKEANIAKAAAEDDRQEKLQSKAGSEWIVYEDVLENVDLQYRIVPGGVKENIILKEETAPTAFTFELKTNQLEVYEEENVLYFLDKEGKEIYRLEAPWMMDAMGVSSDQITLRLEGKKNHYTVSLQADEEWLNEASYPVIIDPVLTVPQEEMGAINNTSVYSMTPNDKGEYNYGGVNVGRQSTVYDNCRGVYQFSLPTRLTSSEQVISAYLCLRERVFII